MFEQTLIGNLLTSEAYCRKVVPYIKEEYFSDYGQKLVYRLISNYVAKYNSLPTKEALLIEVESVNGIKEREYEEATKLIKEAAGKEPESNLEWLIEKTETWCQDRAVYNAILEAVSIIDGSNKEKDKGALPQILSEALGVSFDTAIGHDYFDNAQERYEYYHRAEEQIKFHIQWLNQITNGGVPRKTLNGILAPMNAGKSLVLCDFAAHYMRQGLNVVYISMEMAEERITERIEQNLMNMSSNELRLLDKKAFAKRLVDVKKRTPGRLVVKEYPTAGAHAGHFRHLLNELAVKKKFKADVLIVDYLGICLSQRVRGANANSYTIVKSISEELRGLCVEFNLIGWTASQTTRAGIGNSDIEMSDVSESIGIAATLDFLLAYIRTKELDAEKKAMFKNIKSRYGSTVDNLRALVGVDYDHMALYDLEDGSAVDDDGYLRKKVDIDNDQALWDKSKNPSKKDFGGIKF